MPAGTEPRTRLDDALRELTPEQRSAVDHAGNYALLARPGSGKTRTVGLRLACSIDSGTRRTAVASYTNIAVQEVRNVCREAGVVIGREHFVDTLHAFLGAYVLHPFGHLVCGHRGAIRIRNDRWETNPHPALGWSPVVLDQDKGIRISVVHFHFDRDGKAICHARPNGFYYMDAEQITAAGATQAAKLKRAHAKCGVVSQSDALYWALCVLREHPRIARAVAGRFDEIIVDEAQDTSDVQLACLEVLMATGELRSFVAVADPEQSIYAFQGADPARFDAFARAQELKPLHLTVNFRSSQRICDVAHRFTQRDQADIAAGPNADCPVPPEVIRYPSDQPIEAIAWFRARVAHHGLDPADAVVVVRASRLRDLIEGREQVESHQVLRALGRLAAADARGLTLGAADVRAMEEAILWLVKPNLNYSILPEPSRRRLRHTVGRLRRSLPTLDGTLGEWASACRPHVVMAVDELVGPGTELAHKPQHVLKNLPKYQNVHAAAHFAPPIATPPVRTVHGVKGQSIDSVMLVVEAPRAGRTDQARLLTALASDEPVDIADREELRIGFVSVSRAERYCVVALPDSVAEDVVTRYQAMGFEAPGSA